MVSSGRFRLKRLGSLKIFVTLADDTDGSGETAAAGSIVIFRRNAKRPSVYETIYDAWRSRLEIIDRYGSDGRETGEIAELVETRGRLQTAGLDLQDEDGGTAGGRLTRRIGRVAKDLKHKSNPLKSEARRKAQAGPVRTSKNRKVNRTATQARVTAIDSRLAERQAEVYSILPWMQAMETALRLEIERCFGIVGRLARDVAAVRSGHEFFRTGRTTPNQLRGLAARLRLAKNDLGTLEAAPFREAGRSLKDLLDKAVEYVALGDALVAGNWLDLALARCARVRAQKAIEDLLAVASLMSVAGGQAAAALSGLAGRVDAVIGRMNDQRWAEIFADGVPPLRTAQSALGECRGLRRDGQAEPAEAKLEEFRRALKDVSRRLSR